MRTTYRSKHVVVVDTGNLSATCLDAGVPISTDLFSAKVAWALLSPVDCSYTLVFEREGDDALVPILSDDPHTDEEKARLLALFVTYDKITVKNLTADEPKPKGPYCTAVDKYLCIHAGTRLWNWATGGAIYKRNLSTADITALCNPHKCKARIEAATQDGSLISYLNLGTLTPEEMLRYDRFHLISVLRKEH